MISVPQRYYYNIYKYNKSERDKTAPLHFNRISMKYFFPVRKAFERKKEKKEEKKLLSPTCH